MSNFRLTPEAQSDLIEIRRFTAIQWNRKQSQKYLSELRQTILLLAKSTALGKPRPDIGTDVSSFPHASHAIYYVVHQQELIIFGVLHKRMVPQNHLADQNMF